MTTENKEKLIQAFIKIIGKKPDGSIGVCPDVIEKATLCAAHVEKMPEIEFYSFQVEADESCTGGGY